MGILAKKNAKWLIIVNPNAGRKRGRKDWPVIEALLTKHNFSFVYEFTLGKLHATELTRKYIHKGFHKIIVVGGDGTMNEVVNGIFTQQSIPTTQVMLGMITVGTGNDWGRMFGIPMDYEQSILVIKNQKLFLQDAGMVNFYNQHLKKVRYFANIAGLGFDAVVVNKTNRLKEKGRNGVFLYFLNIFTSLLNYKRKGTSIHIDGKRIYTDLFSMNVGICRYSGGGMLQVPNAIANDGLFDLTIIKNIRRREVIRNIGKLYNGKITEHPKVETHQGKSVRVFSANSLLVETDGESLGHAPFEFSIIPQSIKIIVGESFNSLEVPVLPHKEPASISL